MVISEWSHLLISFVVSVTVQTENIAMNLLVQKVEMTETGNNKDSP